ncbi:MAG TPA: rod shape-determining protein RodA [Myxococcales bacterium]
MELSLGGGESARAAGRLWRHAPWHVLLVALVIAGLGVWNLVSASRVAPAPLWRSQLSWIGIGVAATLLIMMVDYRHLLHLAYPIYGFVLLLLVGVLLKGHSAMGARRWLDLGPMHLQPSELMKIAIILVLARFYHEDARHKEGYSLYHLWLPALLILIPVALVMKQPDLGTAMMIAAVAGSLVIFGKVRWKSLAILVAVFVAGASLAWTHVLKDYQKRRVTSFLDPEADMLGSGYHASQSLIALGSGQGWGKGWAQGTQTQLSFLPEQHTDFIFSVWGEEHGFFGTSMLVLLYLLLLLLAIGVAAGAREKFGTFIAVGICSMLFWHVFINIGMVTGLLPVVGVTLPLMSYGGSSVLTILVGLGLLMNVGMRRHLF